MYISSNIGQATFNDLTNSTILGISTMAAATFAASESIHHDIMRDSTCLVIPAATTIAVISTLATTGSVQVVKTTASMPVKSYSTAIQPTSNDILTDPASAVMPAATTVTTSSTLAAVEPINDQVMNRTDSFELLPALKATATKANISKRNRTTERAKGNNTSDSKTFV